MPRLPETPERLFQIPLPEMHTRAVMEVQKLIRESNTEDQHLDNAIDALDHAIEALRRLSCASRIKRYPPSRVDKTAHRRSSTLH
jgi:hypothetical protein